MNDLKMPPHSKEAEQSVLGGLIQDGSKALEVFGVVKEQDFYMSNHKLIFQAITELSNQNKPFDAVTLSELLESKDMLEYAGGFGYLVELVNNTPGSANILAYAAIVKEKATMRNIIQAVNSVSDMVYHPDGMNADSILERAYDHLRLIDIQTDSEIPTIEDSIISALNQLEFRHENGGEITGVPTGFDKLDATTMGLQKGELYIIGGRPAMGKSTFALNVSINAANLQKHVLFFSLEMPKERLVDKCVSSLGNVLYESIKTGKMEEDEWSRSAHAMSLMKDSGLRIDDRGGQTLSSIIMKCKKLDSKRKIDLIVIDYMQLIRIDGASRYDEVSEVSRQLKSLAKNLECPVIALSQLSRNLESRQDKRPKLSDLRESGQIEQDADFIAFLYRDEVYHTEYAGNKGIAEFLIEKHRFGETGKILLKSELHMSRFVNSDLENYQPYEATKKNNQRVDI